jgi:hypothetical protein
MPSKQSIPDKDLDNKTTQCLQEEYKLGDEISFIIRDKDKEKTGRQKKLEAVGVGVKKIPLKVTPLKVAPLKVS